MDQHHCRQELQASAPHSALGHKQRCAAGGRRGHAPPSRRLVGIRMGGQRPHTWFRTCLPPTCYLPHCLFMPLTYYLAHYLLYAEERVRIGRNGRAIGFSVKRHKWRTTLSLVPCAGVRSYAPAVLGALASCILSSPLNWAGWHLFTYCLTYHALQLLRTLIPSLRVTAYRPAGGLELVKTRYTHVTWVSPPFRVATRCMVGGRTFVHAVVPCALRVHRPPRRARTRRHLHKRTLFRRTPLCKRQHSGADAARCNTYSSWNRRDMICLQPLPRATHRIHPPHTIQLQQRLAFLQNTARGIIHGYAVAL